MLNEESQNGALIIISLYSKIVIQTEITFDTVLCQIKDQQMFDSKMFIFLTHN